jgi:N-acetylmuramoyl-L-alanine amidase
MGIKIELGFLSNKEEGEYLNSEEGQEQMAIQIVNALFEYKKQYFGTGLMVSEIVKITVFLLLAILP